MLAALAAVAAHSPYKITADQQRKDHMLNNSPFTFEEAEEIAEDFEDLVDTEFTVVVDGTSTAYLVDAVVVSPFAEADKQRFADAWYQHKNAGEALAGFSGSDLDVLLFVSGADDETNVSYLGIRQFALERGIKYDFPSS